LHQLLVLAPLLLQLQWQQWYSSQQQQHQLLLDVLLDNNTGTYMEEEWTMRL